MHDDKHHQNIDRLKETIDVAKGLKKADLVIKNTSFLDVFRGKFLEGDIAIHQNTIVGIIDSYEAKDEIDGSSLFVVPGFIDSHVHIESSLMTPSRFEESVLPRGTTCAIWDPHEIANVKGIEGIEWALASTQALLMDIFLMIPSCVPSTSPSLGFETSGAELKAEDIKKFTAHPRVLGLAEMMNYPGVLSGDQDVLTKLGSFESKVLDGHCPGLSGHDLNAYAATGMQTCHESTSLQEAEEKLSKGIHVLIREGSCAKNASSLLSLINEYSSSVTSLCSDDRNPADIIEEGHIDAIIKLGLKANIPPESLFRAASFGAATTYGLKKRGAIAPGYKADLCLVEKCDPNNWQSGFTIKHVIKSGSKISHPASRSANQDLPFWENQKNLNIDPISTSQLAVKPPSSEGLAKVRIIEVLPNQIVTKGIQEELRTNNQKEIVADIPKDILKIAVFERHKNTGSYSVGFVKGFGLKQGAIATSINHDAHNIIAVGVDDHAIANAINRLIEIDGGIVVWRNQTQNESLSLPIGGLMTNSAPELVHLSLNSLKELARKMGCVLHEPFLQLSFLALPVIPDLKITDKGIIDVGQFKRVPLVISKD